MPTSFLKDPDAKLDYFVDWSRWLAGDVIQSSVWAVDDGLTKSNESSSGTVTTVWVEGGEVDQEYELVNQIVTAGGRRNERTLTIRVIER
jgi:hypothetical protein